MSDTMKRPNMAEKYVQQRAAELCLSDIRRWQPVANDDERELMDDLMKVLGSHRNGYELAKELERRCGWDPDADLVAILDNCSYCCTQAINELTRQWVICLGIKPAHAVGDRVRLSMSYGGHKDGLVVKVNAEQASYGVRVTGQSETAHWVVFCESVLGHWEAEAESAA